MTIKVCGKGVWVEGALIRTARLVGDGLEFLADPAAAVDALKESGVRIDLFTFMQRLPHTRPSYRYPMEWDNVAAQPVSTFDHWWTRQINNKTRNMVRRAATKGVTVSEVPFDDELVRGISAIYNESRVRQGKPFSHYREDLETVRRGISTFLAGSVFIGAFFENRLIGFAKLVIDDDYKQAGLMNIVAMVQHRDKAPTNALIAHAVKACADRRIPYLVYSSFSYGKKQRDSLSDFKQHNGFSRIEVPRYYIPLTFAGRAALYAGLHRGFATHIPAPLLTQLRQFRSLWYSGRWLATSALFVLE